MSEPPYYILVAHTVTQSNALVHADIEYRYADDSPLSLLPRFPDEHVLVFNYDPANPAKPTVSSTSSQLALSGVKVVPAPGARVDEDAGKNDNMYILQVTSTADDPYARQLMLGLLFNRSIGLPVVLNHLKPTCRIPGLSSLGSNRGACGSHSSAPTYSVQERGPSSHTRVPGYTCGG